MKVAQITSVVTLAAILAAPLAASANAETNGRNLTTIEALRYATSERSDPNWDRAEPRSAAQGSSQR